MVEKVGIKDYLRSFSAERLIYKPNPGNAGDCVIASATYQLFEDCELDYSIYRRGDPTAGAVVLYGGGGNLVRLYTNARDFIQAHAHQAKRFVLLPHTIEGNESLLVALGENSTVFCREERSFEHVRAHASCEVLAADDLALSLDIARIKSFSRQPPLSLRELISIPRLLLNNRSLRKALSVIHDRKEINCFRTDPEATAQDVPEYSLDLSDLLKYKPYPRYVCDWITHSFLATLDQFERVRTDRLHVGIVSGLLGKDTYLHAGNYFKNRAVYEFSLSDKLRNVHFVQA